MRKILGQFVESRWFSLADLLIVLGSGVIWYFRPEFGWKILLIALLPWGVRLLAGRSPFKYTVFDLPMLVFILTAVIGAKVAYNQQESWAKFWLIVASVLLFYAIAAQPRENTWLFVQAMACLGVLITIFFLLVYDWQANPVRSELINRVGVAWMKVRPTIQYTLKDEDIISNILLVLFPFPVVLLFHARSDHKNNRRLLIFAVVSTAIFVAGLCMAAIMEAVMAFIIGAIVTIWWQVSSVLERGGSVLIRRIFLICSGLVLLLSLFFLIGFPDKVLEISKDLPVLSRFETRMAVVVDTIHLAKDFPFTGGGLGAFPGLYSEYILVIPFFYIPISSNLFLQMAVEQGAIGSLAYVCVLVGGALILIRPLWRRVVKQDQLPLLFLTLAGYVAFMVVGMMDAKLFKGPGIFLLFIIPGFSTFALDNPQGKDRSKHYPDILLGASLVIFVVSLGGNFLATYYANLGAVELARLDLAGWPNENSQVPKSFEDYSSAARYFEIAARLDPGNSTANYRLGLLAIRREDFPEGCHYLQKAFDNDPQNRGIAKNLGYCYVWLGNLDSATAYLRSVPEAIKELEVYSWWWGTKNRNDLSDYANQMGLRLISK